MSNHPMNFLRLPQLKKRVPLSRSGIYAQIAQGTFPAPVRLGPRSVAWIESEIDEWIAKKITSARDREVVAQ